LYNPMNISGANCKAVAPATTGGNDVQPAVELFAYSTIIGAVFYPTNQTGANAIPASVLPGGLGGAFLTMHGSWHEGVDMQPIAVPQLVYVPMNGDNPQTGPFSGSTWTSGSQWNTVLYGFQDPITGNRVGRPTGLAIGPTGSLFVADDYAGVIYRFRPGTGPSAKVRRPR
jgi:glucose/arabinose dehydrogenase